VLGTAADLEALAADIAAGRAGRITLGATLTAAEWLVPRLVAAFRATEPAIEVLVRVLTRAAVGRAIEEHSIQLAIVQDPFAELEAVLLRRHSLVAVSAPEPLVDEPSLPTTLLVREPGSETRLAVESWAATHRPGFTTTMEFASNTALREAAAAGLGLAVLSTDAVGFEIASQAVRLVDLPGLPLHRAWHLTYPGGTRISLAMERFIAFCTSQAGQRAIYS
jgi:DNA-binding transcriptional LysR family regulator